MLDQAAKTEFLRHAGWDNAAEQPVGEDWSQRHISRLSLSGKTVILMHSLPDDDPRLTPGHKSGDYVRINQYLRGLGLAGPEIYEEDSSRGLLLVEDFGETSFHELGANSEMYLAATDVLVHLYKNTENLSIKLPDYYQGHIHTGRRRVIDWYTPAMRGRINEDGLAEAFLDVWTAIEKKLSPVPERFLHIDFHPHNLMWLPQRQGVQRVGLIDFQGAMKGPVPYDLANLLRDARRIVPEDVQKSCLKSFATHLPAGEWDCFYSWYKVLAAQYHARVIGQALRLAIKLDKTHLLGIIPILQKQIETDLRDPLLAPLASFFKENGIDFSGVLDTDLARIIPLIRDDAF
jgi:aminoglycoside/choline kinase family phosphotransferase